MELTFNDLNKLRSAGLISETENAIREGDLIVAVDVATGARRVLKTEGLLLESNRQILKG